MLLPARALVWQMFFAPMDLVPNSFVDKVDNGAGDIGYANET
jgi:hypothetical protein